MCCKLFLYICINVCLHTLGGANAKHDVPSDDAKDVLPSVMDVWYTLDGRRIGGNLQLRVST